MFSLRQLELFAGSRRLTGPQDLDLAPGSDGLVLTGPSGSGKSTLLRVLAGLRAPDRGQVLLQGRDIQLDLQAHRLRVHLIFQQPVLPGDTLREVLNLGALFHGLPAHPDEDLQRGLARLGLEQLDLQQGVQGLSGGESMRVALLRGLLLPVDCLLLDEPTTGLDDESVGALLAVLEDPDTPPLLSASHDHRWIDRCSRRMDLKEGIWRDA